MRTVLYAAIRLLTLFRPKPGKLPLGNQSSVVICSSSGLGDFLMTLNLIDAIRRTFPAARISILASAVVEPMIRKLGICESVESLPNHVFGPAYWKMVRRVRRLRPTHYVGCLPSNTLRQVLLPLFTGIRQAIKHTSPHKGVRNFDFLYSRIVEYPMSRHRRLCNQDLFVALTGIKIDDDPLPPQLRGAVPSTHLQDGADKLVAFHTGSRKGARFKRWPPERFAELAGRLSKEKDVRIVLLGGPDEMDDVDSLRKHLEVEVTDLAGRLSLLETASVLASCRCLVSNDSGIMHLASAVGVPVFAIFGPTDDRHIGPWSPGSRVVRKGSRVEDVQVDDVLISIDASNIL